VQVYFSDRKMRTRHEPWGEKQLTICTWGCTYFSYLDAALPEVPVFDLDVNRHGHGPWHCAFALQARSFEEWMQGWLEGEDLVKSIDLYGYPKFGFEEAEEDRRAGLRY